VDGLKEESGGRSEGSEGLHGNGLWASPKPITKGHELIDLN